MKIVLALVPLLALLSGVLVYNQNGKKEILRFDMVQFFYSFVLMPTVFVWFKGFLFFLLKSELGGAVSQNELFLLDTVYSVFFLFLFAFTVIHSLTKSFELKRNKDPLYDLFEHSEYYHLWVSHTVVFVGAMLLSTLISVANIWIDSTILLPKLGFYAVLATAPIISFAAFKAFVISDFGDFRFLKLMKLFVGIFFLVHGIIFITIEPAFNSTKIMYWYTTNVFGFLSLISFWHSSEPEPLPVHKRITNKAKQVIKKIIRK
jgi:hypothetical protein